MKSSLDMQSAAALLFEKQYQLFLNFNHSTNQTNNALLYLGTQLPILLNNYPGTQTIRYLDVGCGFGNKTSFIINTIKKSHPIKATALDPSQAMLSLFKSQHPIDLVCSTWEAYQPTHSCHLITSIHTFYYLSDWELAITNMMAALDTHGMLCIAIRTNDSACQFRDYFYKNICHIDKIERNSDALSEQLNKMGIQHKVDFVDSTLDINNCLQLNKKGEQLIEFLFRKPYSELTHFQKNEIHSYLKAHHQHGHLSQRDGYFWIPKQSY